MLAALVTLASLNSRCHLFFGAGSTTVLRFGHGWPIHFQEAPVPGPGQRVPNPNGILPNYIWGHPEFNDDPKIMAEYDARLEGMPRTPWGLHSLAEPSVFGAILDALFGLVVLVVVSLLCEVAIRNADRQANSLYSVALFVVVLAAGAAAVSLLVQAAWFFVVPALAVVLASIVVAGVVLSIGYQ